VIVRVLLIAAGMALAACSSTDRTVQPGAGEASGASGSGAASGAGGSGGATGGSPGTGGVGGLSCTEVTTGKASCDACVRSQCCTPIEACINDSACAGLVQCMAKSCATSTNPSDCANQQCSQWLAGADLYKAMSLCFSQSCVGCSECSPGQQEIEACGNCGVGTQSRTCAANSSWGEWSSCSGGGACTPGSTWQSTCDQCSHRVCQSNCTWGVCQLRAGNACDYKSGSNWKCCTNVSGSGRCHYCSSTCQWYPCMEGVCSWCP
jgi:hypothetical protein